MEDNLKISILIIAKKRRADDISPMKALELQGQDIDTEVIIAEGDNPSLQRNELAQMAQGEFLLFFDIDSAPDESILSIYQSAIKRFPNADIFGGPSLLKINQTKFQIISSFFFSSSWGIGPMKSRYNSIGIEREASERELILSNLLIRKEYFIKRGGFNKDFYPSEENEFMKREGQKSRIIYCPEAKVYRFPRPTLIEFLSQMYSYGQGRAKHLSLGIKSKENLFLIPALFALYVMTALLLLITPQAPPSVLYLFPLWVYLIPVVSAPLLESSFKSPSAFVMAPFLFFLGHFSYGVGVLVGLIKYKAVKKFFYQGRKLTYLNLEKIKEFKKVY